MPVMTMNQPPGASTIIETPIQNCRLNAAAMLQNKVPPTVIQTLAKTSERPSHFRVRGASRSEAGPLLSCLSRTEAVPWIQADMAHANTHTAKMLIAPCVSVKHARSQPTDARHSSQHRKRTGAPSGSQLCANGSVPINTAQVPATMQLRKNQNLMYGSSALRCRCSRIWNRLRPMHSVPVATSTRECRTTAAATIALHENKEPAVTEREDREKE
jgi:hypothetical protein